MAPQPRRYLVWGGGGHGKVVADLIRSLGQEVVGYADRDPAKLGRTVGSGGAQVVVTEEAMLASIREARSPAGADAVALGIGGNAVRQAYLRELGDWVAPPLIHPAAAASPSSRLGRGSVVFAGAVINPDARVGEGVIVNSGAIVEHDCLLEDAVHLSPGAVLGGGVKIGERSWIGAGATVIHQISVGADVVVGAGAVVIRDVPDGVTVVGVPAAPVRRGK